MKLGRDYYLHDNVVEIAHDLVGKVLHTRINDLHCSARITETEAYDGRIDKACHAFGGRRTKRTEVMYGEGGLAYVFLCYGIHNLFNVVTNHAEFADAVLIRSLVPLTGLDSMRFRRGAQTLDSKLCSGPGSLSVAMGIDRSHYGLSLLGNTIWIEDDGHRPKSLSTARIGIDYAGDDAKLPWRFIMK